MKKILSQLDHIAVMAIIILAFFPWGGLLNLTGIDITRSIIENITSGASIEDYSIALTVIMAIVTLVMALLKKDNALFKTITFVAPVVGFVYGMVVSSGDYFSSMELAYILVVVLSLVMILKKMGVIKV